MPISTSSDKAKLKDILVLKDFLLKEAAALGFDAIAITGSNNQKAAHHLVEALHHGYHGTMEWMLETAERRMEPVNLWPDVKSVIMLAMNYGPDAHEFHQRPDKSSGNISYYARHRDYHELIKGRLKQIASRFVSRFGGDVKVFVDTAPVMEKPLAQLAGLGWQGKHTNLVSREFGSWLFLGSIFTNVELPVNEPEVDHCGSCHACLSACPTHAFPAPYQLDARRCISYLTIELKEQIPLSFRKAIGNRIYGCDDCLSACPWNKFARTTREIKLKAREELIAPKLDFLLKLDDAAFRSFFTASPVKRIGRNRFIRNCLIAAGNSADRSLVSVVKPHLKDPDPLVAGMAVWALKQLLTKAEFDELAKRSITFSSNPDVLKEWED